MISKYKILYLLVLVFVTLSCRSQVIKCGYTLKYDTISKMNVYEIVDEFPTYVGGDIEFFKYINKTYKVSEDDRQSTFVLVFVVDKKGKLRGVRIHGKLNDEYSNAEKEMIKIFESMPSWNPGMCNGKKVNVLTFKKIDIRYP